MAAHIEYLGHSQIISQNGRDRPHNADRWVRRMVGPSVDGEAHGQLEPECRRPNEQKVMNVSQPSVQLSLKLFGSFGVQDEQPSTGVVDAVCHLLARHPAVDRDGHATDQLSGL